MGRSKRLYNFWMISWSIGIPNLRITDSMVLLATVMRKVLLGIVGGLTNKKIGDNMGLSESSVKSPVQRLFAKAGVKTRSQLVRVALEAPHWGGHAR